MGTVIYLSWDVQFSLGMLNIVICAVLIIVRVHHQKKEKERVLKLSVTGLSCMVWGFLSCLGMLNTSVEWLFGDQKWCAMSMRLNAAAYSLHRVLLYLFIIFRLEVVNKSAFVNPRMINVGKVVIGVSGTFMALTSILSIKGLTTDKQYKCLFDMNYGLIVTLFVIDTSVCVGGTWVFLRPLWFTLKHIESESVRYMVKRTTVWSTVSLMSTFTAALIVAAFDGLGGIFAVDCSVTCFSLVMMMSPMKPRLHSKNRNHSRQKASVEVVESSIVKREPSSREEPSMETLDEHYQKVLEKSRTAISAIV